MNYEMIIEYVFYILVPRYREPQDLLILLNFAYDTFIEFICN